MNVNLNHSKNATDLSQNKVLLNLPVNVLKASAAEFSKDKKFSDNTLKELYSIFGETFKKALELYESGRITHVSASESQSQNNVRTLLQVKGFSATVYTIFRNVNFCTCKAFRYQVLESQSAFTCKHVLAAWIALLDNKKLVYHNVTPVQFRGLLLYHVS